MKNLVGRAAVAFVAFVSLSIPHTARGERASGNLFRIDSLSLDSATHRLRLSWTLDTTALPGGIEASITAVCGSSPPPEPSGAFQVTALRGDTLLPVDPLVFDTAYHIGLWLRRSGVWIPPDSASGRVLRIDSVSWEPVAFFSGADTVRALSGRLVLWRNAEYGNNIPPCRDTVRLYRPPDDRLRGFVRAGEGIRFARRLPSPPLFVGLRIDLPNPSLAGKVRIFRDSAGYFLNERGSTVDSARGLVYVKTTRLDLPFIPLVDTLKPGVVLLGDTSLAVDSVPPDLSVRLRDNCANVSWRLYSGGGSDALFPDAPLFSGACADTAAEFTRALPVPAGGAGACGVRTYLVVDDGTGCDTINGSRRGIRRVSDEMTTEQEVIMPLSVTADLDSTNCRFGLRALFERCGGQYDKKEFRLFRWRPEAVWAEYSSFPDTLFSFFPGKLFWLITREKVPIDFGRGYTPSLKIAVQIKCAPKAWTDFSMPFRFAVPLDGVVAATGLCGKKMQLYRWVKDDEHRTYTAAPLFCGGVPGMDSLSGPLPYGRYGFFTVYNPFDTAFVLRIPPTVYVPSMRRTARYTPESGADEGWCIRIDTRLGEKKGGTVFCAASASANSPEAFPLPPSFTGQSLAVRQYGGSGDHGTLVLPLRGDSVLVYELSVSNPYESEITVGGAVTRPGAGALPGGILAIGNKLQPLSGAFSFTLSPRASSTVLCIVGDPGQVARFVNSRLPVRPYIAGILRRPGSGTIAVSFFPGPGARQSIIRLFDLRGKCVAEARYGEIGAAGPVLFTLSRGALAGGCYCIRLTTLSKSGQWESDVKTVPFLW